MAEECLTWAAAHGDVLGLRSDAERGESQEETSKCSRRATGPLVNMPRQVHVYSTTTVATDTVAQLIEASKVPDRDKQRPHERSRFASRDKEFE